MLDMGFIPDVERILSRLPQKRQSLFFSATMPPDVARLARQMLRDPRQVEIERTVATMPKIEQRVLFVARDDKRALLAELLAGPAVSRALVFTRTKHRARDLARHLLKAGVRADAIHGDRSQSQRQRALDAFHDGSISVLVATDIAARGLDVDDIDHVINYELPTEPESYVHRIGRTARAGKEGIALSLCDATEVEALRDIEKITQKLPVTDDHRYHDPAAAAAREALDQRRGGGRPAGGRPAPRAQQAAPGRGGPRGPAGRVPRSGTWGGRGYSRGRS
jgi:ATP-dependent RNA helicase RhlE